MPHMSLNFRRGLMVAAASLVALPALAASPDSGQLLNEQQQRPARLPDRLPQPESKDLPVGVPDADARQVLVKAFRFTDIEGLATEEELNQLVQPYVGKSLTFNQLQEVANAVTAYLREKGWPLVQAYLPRQDVTDGEIEIAVIRGHVESSGVVVRGGENRISNDTAKAFVDGALPQDGGTPGQYEFERGVLLLNDLPAVSAKTTLERGAEANSTRVLVDVTEGSWYSGAVNLDNYGNRYTGGFRKIANAALNSPFALGDQLSVSGTLADRLWMEQLGYSLPLGTSGLRLSGSYTNMHYKIGKENVGLVNSGLAKTYDIRASYPIIRTRMLNVSGALGYTYKVLTDKTTAVVTSDRRVADWQPSLTVSNFDSLGGGGLSTATLSTTIGRLDRSRMESDETTDAASAHSTGTFHKLNLSAARLQRLTSDFSLFGSFNGQFADKNLDSSEKLILGGPSGIRAYPVGEGSGDVGWLTNIELRYDVPVDLPIGMLQLVTFYDAGGIKWNRSRWQGDVTSATGRNYYNLSGAGVGLNLSLANIYAIRASWARTLGDNNGESTSGNNANGLRENNQLWLSGIVYF
ncbi:ShlB/FhaC/HecB family hemolysin secretion/activation protein [Magnetospirillum aberrantis]|uniref:ShlB/FhaC/HecB family hemolysin secretion/activation protein n=1 Tax=Magnetospirillum aberrantis SpK TaxID=908842 RepID=A0A7C9UUQ1_9PROT|nr:ShlB/FhaC/HecB family hemolysin secretion/activation protein [Magnetospirillum aberrantis]NFV80888.1 ShlB/FhaC/HecB family hemolysin secretion/activation protein [Magnetospirillum aberrantis SpK]